MTARPTASASQNPEGVTIDEFGRCIPPTNRFPSAANGAGFKPLADKIHAMGLKFGIHIMRGIPRKAVAGRPADCTAQISRRSQAVAARRRHQPRPASGTATCTAWTPRHRRRQGLVCEHRQTIRRVGRGLHQVRRHRQFAARRKSLSARRKSRRFRERTARAGGRSIVLSLSPGAGAAE